MGVSILYPLSGSYISSPREPTTVFFYKVTKNTCLEFHANGWLYEDSLLHASWRARRLQVCGMAPLSLRMPTGPPIHENMSVRLSQVGSGAGGGHGMGWRESLMGIFPYGIYDIWYWKSIYTKNYAKSREIGIPNNSRISVFIFIYLIWYIGLDL